MKNLLTVGLTTLLTISSVDAQKLHSINGNANTYSIVAYDKNNNQMGVAVQSHYFGVGSIVTWAEPGGF